MGRQLDLDIKKTSSEIYAILKNFCSTDTYCNDIIEPFSIGVFTYASDGHHIVRVPRIPEAEIQSNSNIIESVLKFDWTISEDPAYWLDFPKYTLPEIPAKVECDKCDKDGEINCPSCDGEGDLTFNHEFTDKKGNTQWHNYQVECEHCDGYGKVECDCDNVPFKKTPIRIPIDERDVDAWKLDKFKVFNNVKISVHKRKDIYGPILLKFDEGCALLMELNELRV